MASSNLKKELDYFIKHQDKLVEKYEGQFIVLKNQKIIGTYQTMRDAYWKTQKEHPLGTFAIYHCIRGPEAYSATFHSRVFFR